MAWDDLINPYASLSAKYDEAITQGWSTVADKNDALSQQQYFDDNRAAIVQLYPDQWVCVANKTIYANAWRTEAIAAAQAANPRRQFYCEPVKNLAAAALFHDA